MDASRVSLAGLVGLLVWIAVYYQACTPAVSAEEDGLQLAPGDTVGQRPTPAVEESLRTLAPETFGVKEAERQAEAAPENEPAIREPQEAPRRVENYTIRSGDTMQSIAKAWYGSSAEWVRIAKENPKVDPRRLRAGQVLRIPNFQTAQGDAEPGAAADTSGAGSAQTYVVRAGDTLSAIAAQFYGDSTLWKVIYDANREKITRVSALKPGTELVIPAR